MAQLYWFHAFNRKLGAEATTAATDAELVAQVLHDGPTIHPNPNNDTRVHEGRLNITPNRVYAYLGRTKKKFGDNLVVLTPQGLSAGHMSPFDTGGLVNKIAPLSTCDDQQRQDYVFAFTWDIPIDKDRVLAKYPSTEKAGVDIYLSGKRPAGDGPHVSLGELSRSDDPPNHAIWPSNTDWRAWTWEGRVEPPSFNLHELKYWTCATSMKKKIVAAARVRYGDDRAWLISLNAKHREGGVGKLVRLLRKEQAA